MPARRSTLVVLLALVFSLAVGTAPALATPPTPSFSTKTDYSSAAGGGHSPGRMAIADLNDDGCRDVVVANTGGTATAAVMFGVATGATCTGALASATALSLPNRPRDVKLGDLNGDGCLDIVSADDTSSISRFLNTKTGGACTGSFGTIATYTAYQRASGLALADLDVDGCLDVAVAAWNFGGGWENPSKVSVFLGNKSGGVCSGTFASYVNYSIGTNGQGPLAVAAGDLNADGCLDLVSANRRSFDRWSALLGIKTGASCTGTFSTGVLYQGTGKGEAEDVALVDLNGDTHLDLVGVTTGQSDSPVMVRLGGTGAGGVAVGTFQTAVEYAAGSNTNPEVVDVADVNNDGFLDVVIGYYSASYVSVYAGNGDGTLVSKVDFAATGSTTGLAMADMNNDGAPDIVASNRNNPGTLSVLLNQIPVTRQLTVIKAGSGAGSVTSSPSGITCGSTCSASFAATASVTLTATPDSSSTFAGWSGACTGTGACTVSMLLARSVTATFDTTPAAGETASGSALAATGSASGAQQQPTAAGRLDLDLEAVPLMTDSGAAGRFVARWRAVGGTSATTITVGLPKGMSLDASDCAKQRGDRIEIAIPRLADGDGGSCAFTVSSATTRRIKLRAVTAGQTESADVRPRAASPRAWLRSAINVLTTGAARSALATTLDGYWAGSVSREDALAALRRDVLAIRTRQLAMEHTVPLAPDSLRDTAALTRRALTLSRKADLAFIAWLNGDDSARFDAIRYSDLASDAKRRLVTDLEQRGANPPSPWAI